MTMTLPTIAAEAETGSQPATLLAVLRRDLGAQIAIAVLLAWVVVGITVPYWAPYDPLAFAGPRMGPPDAAHWFGTDALGRDVWSRTLYGVRYSLPLALGVIGSAVVIGVTLGMAAGFFGGWIDYVLMRIVDITVSFPALILAMSVVAVLGPGIVNSGIALIVVWWPIYARLMRAEVLSMKERDHVMAATVGGASSLRIMRKHILPLCWAPILVNGTTDIGIAIISIAGLSFIGLGSTPPAPEWGLMIYEGSERFFSWWIAAAPGLAMMSIALSFNFLGDALQRALDPKRSNRR